MYDAYDVYLSLYYSLLQIVKRANIFKDVIALAVNVYYINSTSTNNQRKTKMTIQFDATYSAEDNKLRIYASARFDDELWQRFKALGFKWAPKQDLFVAPSWTPEREDFCLELAEEITAEDKSLAERAEDKIERIKGYKANRERDASHYAMAASQLGERFASGQPILIGHHSERSARRDQDRINRYQENAVAMAKTAEYWSYKANGVAHHANSKSSQRVIASRIKTLLKDLRDFQRSQANAEKKALMWAKVDLLPDNQDKREKVEILAGGYDAGCKVGTWGELRDGKLCPFKLAGQMAEAWEKRIDSQHRMRWINHTLNRLDYEQSRAPKIARFEGELTPVIIQGFVRTHGGDKPKATKIENGFKVECNSSLPMHLGKGNSAEYPDHYWRDLMENLGYFVDLTPKRKSNKPKPAPLINPTEKQAQLLQDIWNGNPSEWNKKNGGKTSEIVIMTQAQYSARSKGDYGICKTVNIMQNGEAHFPHWSEKEKPTIHFRVRIMESRTGLYAPDRVVVISDKAQKSFPIDIEALANKDAA